MKYSTPLLVALTTAQMAAGQDFVRGAAQVETLEAQMPERQLMMHKHSKVSVSSLLSCCWLCCFD